MTANRVVIAEPFAESGLDVLRDRGIEVDVRVGSPREALLRALVGAAGLIVRSETRVDRELLDSGASLRVVGRAGVGVDAIDVGAATDAGIVVLNTPSANTIAATEHTFALLLSLVRHLSAAHESLKRGEWKRAPFVGTELFGKSLGIVGLGRIGGAVATRAAAFGMEVLASDPFVTAARAQAHGATLLPLDELLGRVDILTVHVPLNAQTLGLIDAKCIGHLKSSALVVNCARGGVIDEHALLEALESGRVRGAAIDVVREEPPPPQSPGALLQRHAHVVATPHLGGSTHEALARIATELARDVANVLEGRPADGAVNAPIAGGADAHTLRPFVDVAHRMGVIFPQLRESPMRSLVLTVRGEIAECNARPLAAAFLSGLLAQTTDRRVSIVNAEALARELGIVLDVRCVREHDAYAGSIAISDGENSLVGTSLHNGARIVEIDGFEVDAIPSGALIVTRHSDVPGMIGRVGTALGDAGFNISTMQVARSSQGGEAMMVLSVDRPLDAPALEALRAIPMIRSVRALAV